MLYKDLEEYQQENFVRLRDYIKERFGDKMEDDSFNMESFADNGDGFVFDPCEVPECGAVCCLIGHAVLAGCKPKDLTNLSDWYSYYKDAFGLGWEDSAWNFLFSSFWPSEMQEAIARIDIYENGFDPENDKWDFGSVYTQS